MNKVFKFTLTNSEKIVGTLEIATPEVFKPLSLQVQDGQICLWAMVDPVSRIQFRKFVVGMTGETLPDVPMQHIGTVLLDGGSFVLHVFMVTE